MASDFDSAGATIAAPGRTNQAATMKFQVAARVSQTDSRKRVSEHDSLLEAVNAMHATNLMNGPTLRVQRGEGEPKVIASVDWGDGDYDRPGFKADRKLPELQQLIDKTGSATAEEARNRLANPPDLQRLERDAVAAVHDLPSREAALKERADREAQALQRRYFEEDVGRRVIERLALQLQRNDGDSISYELPKTSDWPSPVKGQLQADVLREVGQVALDAAYGGAKDYTDRGVMSERGVEAANRSVEMAERVHWQGRSEVEAARAIEEAERAHDPDSAATELAKEDRKAAEYVSMTANAAMTPEVEAKEARKTADFDTMAAAAGMSPQEYARHLNDLDRNGVADHLDQAPPAQQYTVQFRDETKGVFVDAIQTNSAIEANQMFGENAGKDARVLDNDAGDYAAEWRKEHPSALAVPHYHERLDFAAEVQRQTQAELQGAINKRAALQARFDHASEAVSVSVDQVRDTDVPARQVQDGYAAASVEYAAAKRDLDAFEAKPAEHGVVVAKFRELQALERAEEQTRIAVVHNRIDGVATDAVQAAEKAHTQAAQAVSEFLNREGVKLPPATERTSNEIEAGLTPDQMKRLIDAPRLNEAEQQLDRDAKAAATAAKPTPTIGEAQNQVRDQSAFADAAARDRLVPESVAAAYKREGQKYLDANDPKRVAFVDKGNRLQTVRTFDDKAVEAMIQTADARGWSEIKVTGDEAFRRKAWIDGTARGLEVKGYEPTEKDKVRAEQLAKQTGHANAIEENETLKAYRATRDADTKTKREAGRQHPDLVNAYALEAAARSFGKQRLSADAVDKFVDATRANIERALAKGEKIPEIRKRQEQDRQQDHGQER